MVQDRTRVINRIHSLLDRHDVTVDATSVYSEKSLRHLESAHLKSPHDEIVLAQCVRQIRYLTEEIAIMDSYLEKEAANNEDAQLIASMTGMGSYSALLLAVEIDDINRFDSSKKLVSWAGLCPTVHQSGDQMYMGRIKKFDTDRLANWIMCEAANTAVRYDPKMKSIYEAARRRHAGKHALAIIVVANKMINILWHILKTRTPYESRNEALYQRKLAKMEKMRKKKENNN